MSRYTISEEDLTINTDIDVTANIVYVPGMTLNDVEEEPTIYSSANEFTKKYGTKPYKFKTVQIVDGKTLFSANEYEKSYIYAIELLNMGLQVSFQNIISLKDYIGYDTINSSVINANNYKDYYLITPVVTEKVTAENYRDYLIKSASRYIYAGHFDETENYYVATQLESGNVDETKIYTTLDENDYGCLQDFYDKLTAKTTQNKGEIEIEDTIGTQLEVGTYEESFEKFTTKNQEYGLVNIDNFKYSVLGNIPYNQAGVPSIGLPAGNTFAVKLKFDGKNNKTSFPDGEIIIVKFSDGTTNKYTKDALEDDGSLISVLNVKKSSKVDIIVTVQEGITYTYTFLFDTATFENTSRNTNETTIYKTLLDRWTYNVKYITTGGYPTIIDSANEEEYNLLQILLKVAAARADTVALIDGTQEENIATLFNNINTNIEDRTKNGDYYIVPGQGLGAEFGTYQVDSKRKAESTLKYGSIIGPWGIYSVYNSNLIVEEIEDIKLPSSFGYLLSVANTINILKGNNYDAIAGIIRGNVPHLKQLVVETTGAEAELVQTTEKDKIGLNSIVKVQGYGYCIWGNRTLFPNQKPIETTSNGTLVASSFLNIRVLATDVKKTTFATCQKYTFETNTTELWLKFKSDIEKELDKMVANGVLEKYEITKQVSTERATLSAYIKLWTIYAVENFDIVVGLTDSTVEEVE